MKCFLATALSALLLTTVSPAQLEQNDLNRPVETTLTAIRTNPEAFRGIYAQFDLQFDTVGQVQNPFFTRFVPSEFVNFFAWDGQQPIWRREEFRDVFAMLFMSKENDQANEVHRLRLYDRVRCTAIVRSTFQGKPWIEVLNFEPLMTRVDTPTLAHLYRAESWMGRRDWNKAISELSLAADGQQPNFVRAAVQKNLGLCYMRMGEVDAGRSHLRTALTLAGDENRELVALERQARSEPRSQLDLEVSSRQVSDAARPMWEAFDESPRAPIQDQPRESSTESSTPASPAR